ncbi:AbrB family transcriptional regulator [Cupriavidus sp. 30B13]|uniref:AbrB family transcriptional regulator n=1 Tax=Cupriavidus sp. 30B13 TaxID=3384241 RepID=UPI003B8F6231
MPDAITRNPPRAPDSATGKAGRVLRWVALAGFSAALAAALEWLGVPAARLFGPLLAGIMASAAGARLRVAPAAFLVSQGLIGCMIASMLPSWFYGTVAGRWPVFAAGVVSVIAVSGALGWWLTRRRVLPGTTALWGLSPGAATAMILMAESYGGDAELVAFMQYLRVIVVAAVAAVVARIWGVGEHHAHLAAGWFAPVPWLPLLETLALAVLGPAIAHRLRIRAGAFLLPLFAGMYLAHHGWIRLALPPWLLMLAYAMVGWRIGFRFTRPLLLHAARALPRLLMCTLALVGACGALAALLVLATGVDPLSAYLAMSPGGADTVALIAASSHVDVPFVMAMQMLRFLAVLLLRPPLARFFAARAGRRASLS